MAPDSPELRHVERVRLLQADRSLGSGLSNDELAMASRYAVADAVALARGKYAPRALFDGKDLLGLLVLDGLLIRQVAVGDRHCGELVGPGAVLRPWDDFGQIAPLPFEVSWRVIQPTRLAQLDRRFLATIVHWPALIETFTARATERAHTLAFNVAIHCLRHVHLRLLALLWHLADRYGRVIPEGTHVPLPLSHADLAELVGAQRPSVSVALKRLADAGLVSRGPENTWLLSHEPPSELRDMRARKASTAVLAGFGEAEDAEEDDHEEGFERAVARG
ncbi:MAG TPA: helix-turn-helix domain-containing protein [Solirubrobacteraceae bacterium]|nr:helix-turn-helix domain-containing protein [Solirubrobacteraceae bacterium]